MQFENISIRCETSCTVDITSMNLSHFLRFYDIVRKSMHQRSRYVTCIKIYIVLIIMDLFVVCGNTFRRGHITGYCKWQSSISTTLMKLTVTLTLNPTNRNDSKTTERNSVRHPTSPQNHPNNAIVAFRTP